MRTLLLFGLCLLATGCADLEMKQGSRPMARRDIPPGPGLLTGTQGEFVIFRLKDSQPAEAGKAEAAPSAEQGGVAK